MDRSRVSRSIRGLVKRMMDWVQRIRGCKPKTQPVEDAIHTFFQCGSQYYVAGRWGMFAGLMPVAGNLHHHAIEMLLKGALSKTMSLEDLRFKLGHGLPKIWKRFKKQTNDASLGAFDKVIKELSKFEDIRYPDKLIAQGASMMFDITRVGAAQSFVTGVKEPQYKLCLEDIDELVLKIFELGNRNPAVYLRFVKPEARDYIVRENVYFKSPFTT